MAIRGTNQDKWDRLPSQIQQHCINCVRIAARHSVLRGEFSPILINGPHELGMSNETIQDHWAQSARRALHLLGIVRGGS